MMITEQLAMPVEARLAKINDIRSCPNRYYDPNLPIEKVLKHIHERATTGSIFDQDIHSFRTDAFAFMALGLKPPADRLSMQMELEILEKIEPNFTIYRNQPFGEYRIVGFFPPNPNFKDSLAEMAEFHTMALPVQQQDYLIPNSPFYHPPVINIHKLMHEVCLRFDQRIAYARNKKELAEVLAELYFWGQIMIHPFLGGSHRAFDRIIDLVFAYHNIPVQTPLDHTCNIDPQDPFNQELSRQRRQLLIRYDLHGLVIKDGSQKSQRDFFGYQGQLNEAIRRGFYFEEVDINQIAQVILAWEK